MIDEARLLIRTRKAGLSVPSVWDLDYEAVSSSSSTSVDGH